MPSSPPMNENTTNNPYSRIGTSSNDNNDNNNTNIANNPIQNCNNNNSDSQSSASSDDDELITNELIHITNRNSNNSNGNNSNSNNNNSIIMEEGNTSHSLNQPLSFSDDDDHNNNNTNQSYDEEDDDFNDNDDQQQQQQRQQERQILRQHRRRRLGRRIARQINRNRSDEDTNVEETPILTTTTTTSEPTTINNNIIPTQNAITITILDSAQSKFTIVASKKWNTIQLKEQGYKIHSVPPVQQRLICMGKLLQDNLLLEDQIVGLSGSGSNGGVKEVIVHLFPKPNVVIENDNRNSNGNDISTDQDPNNSSSNSGTPNPNSPNGGNNTTGGAHIPQIILDQEEISRRGQILVLSSHEAYEAMHRVRLLSFLLLAYSTLQILRDITIYLAPPDSYTSDDTIIPPGDPTDTASTSYEEGEEELPKWEDRDYVEIAISILGVYVALLGMKATTEHVSYIAKRFLILLGVLGVSWTLYTFYCHVIFNLALEKALLSDEISSSELNKTAVRISIMETTLPFFMWVMFYIRSLQFYTMIREAELDAVERARSLIPTATATSTTVVGNDGGGGSGGERGNGSNDVVNGESYDLELQREDRVLT